MGKTKDHIVLVWAYKRTTRREAILLGPLWAKQGHVRILAIVLVFLVAASLIWTIFEGTQSENVRWQSLHCYWFFSVYLLIVPIYNYMRHWYWLNQGTLAEKLAEMVTDWNCEAAEASSLVEDNTRDCTWISAGVISAMQLKILASALSLNFWPWKIRIRLSAFGF